MPYKIISYLRLPYLHVSKSALLSTQYFSTLILYIRSLDTFYRLVVNAIPHHIYDLFCAYILLLAQEASNAEMVWI